MIVDLSFGFAIGVAIGVFICYFGWIKENTEVKTSNKTTAQSTKEKYMQVLKLAIDKPNGNTELSINNGSNNGFLILAPLNEDNLSTGIAYKTDFYRSQYSSVKDHPIIVQTADWLPINLDFNGHTIKNLEYTDLFQLTYREFDEIAEYARRKKLIESENKLNPVVNPEPYL